jgi:rhodanese-related sulfurtransferase
MRSIDANELNEMMNGNEAERVAVIDTLPADHYENEHIPGAHSVPLKQPDFVSRVDELVDQRSDPVVVYCANTECDLSPNAAEELEKAGFSNIVDFEGGIEEWKSKGFATAGAQG